MELQELKMIPLKSLPILMNGPLKNTIEVVDMYYSDFTSLWGSIATLLKDLETEVPDARELALAADTFPQDRELQIKHHSLLYKMAMIIIYAMTFLFSMCFKSSDKRNVVEVGHSNEHVSPTTGSSTERHQEGIRKEKGILDAVDDGESYIDSYTKQPSRLSDLPPLNQVKDVLSLIFTRMKTGDLITSIPDKEHGPSPYSLNALRAKHPLLSILTSRITTDNRNQDTLSVEAEILHYAALSVQIMSLGLQAYAQAHTGELEFSFIDRGVSKIILKGGGIISKVATAELQQLTCFGSVTNSPVLVFNIGDPVDIDLSSKQDSDPCDIISSLDNIASIWGGKCRSQLEFYIPAFILGL